MKPTRPRHNSVKTVLDGITFASKSEAARYVVLKSLEKQGKITGLELQKRFEIAPNCHLQGRKRPARYYVADFCYFDAAGAYIVEDVKGKQYGKGGMLTDVYKLKRHLMMTIHGIEILET